MSDQQKNPFEIVERGPAFSDRLEVAPPPAGGAEDAHPSVAALRERFPDAVRRAEVSAGDQHVVYVDPDANLEVLGFLKTDDAHHYDLLVDVTAVDYGGGLPLQVVYQLWSIPHRRALRVKCELPLERLHIRSVTGLWNSANWLEREVFDLFGITFEGHPDLRRILMPENYAEGHPLRKDFPLRGRFSRAEQTRRALSQDPKDYYIPEELEVGGAPSLPEALRPRTLEDGSEG
ncbi:MAG: NADH-quinone oxidoreductase subunit C [Gemmatimonadetes bacterium]|nr:MAG: NADH-quinone oxidoreductase subunit C [Gemmatimonadota bacterium]